MQRETHKYIEPWVPVCKRATGVFDLKDLNDAPPTAKNLWWQLTHLEANALNSAKYPQPLIEATNLITPNGENLLGPVLLTAWYEYIYCIRTSGNYY